MLTMLGEQHREFAATLEDELVTGVCRDCPYCRDGIASVASVRKWCAGHPKGWRA